MGTGLTGSVVEFIVRTDADAIPADVLRAAGRVFIDTLAAIVAGSDEAAVRILRDFARSECAAPRALLLGSVVRTSPQLAALINATAAHAIELDDACNEGHLSAVLVPTVLALAEDLACSGRDALAAFCIGFEVASKIGRALQGDDAHHHWQGWHTTPAHAALGAAAASAWLLRLDRQQTACALGLASTGCAGFRKNFGTMTKPFHAGHAAQSGVVAATLARSGFSASPEILDAPLGFFDVLAAGHQQLHHLDTLGVPWSLTHPGVNVRLYPSCYLTMRVADAILRGEYAQEAKLSIAADCIARVELRLNDTEANTLVHNLPQTGLQAKFSAQYVAAAALLDGDLTQASFDDAMVRRPAAQALMQKMYKFADAGAGPVQIRIVLSDGNELIRRCAIPLGAAQRPLDNATLEAKFRRCGSTRLEAAAIESALLALVNLEQLGDVGMLVKPFAGIAH